MKQLWHSKSSHMYDLLKTAVTPTVCITDDIHLSKRLFPLLVLASRSDIWAWYGMDTTLSFSFRELTYFVDLTHIKVLE
jgi:hypothetical protein